MKSLAFGIILCLSVHFLHAGGWKAGVAGQVITPADTVWMAGYAFRSHTADSTSQNLWIKALVLEDSLGTHAVLVTSDLLGFPRNISTSIARQLQDEYKLDRSRIILSSSHTHSGPVLRDALYPVYPLNDEREKLIEKYSDWLEIQIVQLVSQAFRNLESVSVFRGMGTVRFGVNRRNNPEADIEKLTELAGPADHSVPVLMAERTNGTPMAIVFGYACHATVLSSYHWSGDYPGYAQEKLEAEFPQTVTMFFAGAGGDINPIPRRSVPLAKQYGEELASAVKRTVSEKLTPLRPIIHSTYEEVDLPYAPLPEKAYLQELQQNSATSSYEKRWASLLMERMQKGEEIPHAYSYYPIQTWQMGDQIMVVLGGEVVVEYAIRIKRLLGPQTFVMAYANDVMAYIPSLRILREGGYEGFSSSRVYNRPSTWAPEIEEIIIRNVYEQYKSLPSRP